MKSFANFDGLLQPTVKSPTQTGKSDRVLHFAKHVTMKCSAIMLVSVHDICAAVVCQCAKSKMAMVTCSHLTSNNEKAI